MHTLIKPTVGRVHVGLYGSARGDKARALRSAGSCFPGAALAVTDVQVILADEMRGLRAGTQWTVTAYPA